MKKVALVAAMLAFGCGKKHVNKTDEPPLDPDKPNPNLSVSYNGLCVSCHGLDGRAVHPLRGYAGSLDQYRYTVRTGLGGRMPAYPAAVMPEDQLTADYNYFRSHP